MDLPSAEVPGAVEAALRKNPCVATCRMRGPLTFLTALSVAAAPRSERDPANSRRMASASSAAPGRALKIIVPPAFGLDAGSPYAGAATISADEDDVA